MSVMRRWVSVAACVVAVLPLSGCHLFDTPLRRDGFWVNPNNPAARDVRERPDEGKNGEDAELLRRIAQQPVA